MARRFLVLVLVSCMLLTLGCVKQLDDNPFQTDELAIISATPRADESDVPVNAFIYLTFTRPLNREGVSGQNFVLRRGEESLPLDIRFITDMVLAIAPQQALNHETAYHFEAGTNIRDTEGQFLSEGISFSFKTAPPRSIHQVKDSPLADWGSDKPGTYKAGVAKVDITPPKGVPLSGYGGGERRVFPPDLKKDNYHTLFKPSEGTRDPLSARALVIANEHERVAVVTVDLIAAQEEMIEASWRKASERGFTIPMDKVLFCASHTHSGPGAFTKLIPWQYLAVDCYVDEIFQELSNKIADAMVQAEQNLKNATIGIGRSEVFNATTNRRAEVSTKLKKDSIDPEMLVIRVDHADTGKPMATVWNFAIHGTHFPAEHMLYSADIMGEANRQAEIAGDLGMPLFINGAEGDISPQGALEETGRLLVEGMRRARADANAVGKGVLQSKHQWIDMGPAILMLSLEQHADPGLANSGFARCLRNMGLKLGLDFSLPESWTPRRFRFQALRLGDSAIASFPGEPIHQIGLAVKEEGRALGFKHVLIAGLANGHGSYFTTKEEYDVGGYEGLASFFGEDNGTLLQAHSKTLLNQCKPKDHQPD